MRRLTPTQHSLLTTIGLRGAGRKELGDSVDSEPLRELIADGYVDVLPPRRGGTSGEASVRQADDLTALWFLTAAGASAIGLKPDAVRDALLWSE